MYLYIFIFLTEIKLTGIWEQRDRSAKEQISLDFKVYRKLKSFFEQKCHVVLYHFEKSIHFKIKVPSAKALNTLVQAIQSSPMSAAVSSTLGIPKDHFKLELERNRVESVRAIFDKNRKYITDVDIAKCFRT